MKVFMELASISAGENDTEIDRLTSFQDAVSGYSPLLYSLPETAGFEELIARAQEVWDTLKKDEKLPEKLVSLGSKIFNMQTYSRSHTVCRILRLLVLSIWPLLKGIPFIRMISLVSEFVCRFSHISVYFKGCTCCL